MSHTRKKNTPCAQREAVSQAQRIVVKVGTHTLASKKGRPHRASLERIVDQIAALRAEGREVVLVSSGAVGMGLDALKLSTRPKTLAALQMAAAVGQTRLLNTYQELFSKHGLVVGQVLLTQDDFHDRQRNLNARATFRHLLSAGVIPIVNENDAISVDEIRFGDNDHLAAHLSLLLDVNLLVLLTTVSGLQDRSGQRARRIPLLEDVEALSAQLVGTDSGVLSSGGMKSKLEAATLAQGNGVSVVIANGRKADSLSQVLEGADVGTLLPAKVPKHKRARKRWLGFARRVKGDVVVDDGAVRALCERNSSLLPVGVVQVRGSFLAGELVRVVSEKGDVLAKGIVNYSFDEVAQLKGCRSSEIAKRLGSRQFDEIIHRDNLVLL